MVLYFICEIASKLARKHKWLRRLLLERDVWGSVPEPINYLTHFQRLATAAYLKCETEQCKPHD